MVTFIFPLLKYSTQSYKFLCPRQLPQKQGGVKGRFCDEFLLFSPWMTKNSNTSLLFSFRTLQ
jgi:hypothetical protein